METEEQKNGVGLGTRIGGRDSAYYTMEPVVCQYLASFPGPREGGEKDLQWFPLFAHALNYLQP